MTAIPRPIAAAATGVAAARRVAGAVPPVTRWRRFITVARVAVHPMPRRIGRRLRVALDVPIPVDAIIGRIGTRELPLSWIVIPCAIVVESCTAGIAVLPGKALAGGHRPAAVAHAAIRAVELRPGRAAAGGERLGDAAQ